MYIINLGIKGKKQHEYTFFACTVCFPNTNHVIILRGIGPLFCSLKRARALFLIGSLRNDDGNDHDNATN